MAFKKIPVLQPGDTFYKGYLIRKIDAGHICHIDGKVSTVYKSYMHVTNAIDNNSVKWLKR